MTPPASKGSAYLKSLDGGANVVAVWAYKNDDGTYRVSTSGEYRSAGTAISLVKGSFGGAESSSELASWQKGMVLFALPGWKDDDAVLAVSKANLSKTKPRVTRAIKPQGHSDVTSTDRLNQELLDNYGRTKPDFTHGRP